MVVDGDGNEVELQVEAYAMQRTIGQSTTTQRTTFLVVDTIVGRLPAPELTGLDLDDVQRVEVLGDDVYLVVPNTPVALDDVESPLAKPLNRSILTT